MTHLLKTGIRLRILAGCAVLMCTCPPVFAESKTSGAFQRISKMEESMFGANHREQPLESRLEALEQKAFGKAQGGSVSKRVAALEQHISKTKAEFMPPIAPSLDNGYHPQPHSLSTAEHSEPAAAANAAGSQASQSVSGAEQTAAAKSVLPATDGPPVAPPIAETVRRNNEATCASSGPGYVTKDGDQTVLHASATDFGSNGGAQHFTNPLAPNTLPFPPGYPQIQQTQLNAGAQQQRFSAGRFAGSLATGVGRAAVTGAIRGNVGSAVIGSAARIGLRTAIGAAAGGGGGLGSAGAVLNALHCPICRLLH